MHGGEAIPPQGGREGFPPLLKSLAVSDGVDKLCLVGVGRDEHNARVRCAYYGSRHCGRPNPEGIVLNYAKRPRLHAGLGAETLSRRDDAVLA